MTGYLHPSWADLVAARSEREAELRAQLTEEMERKIKANLDREEELQLSREFAAQVDLAVWTIDQHCRPEFTHRVPAKRGSIKPDDKKTGTLYVFPLCAVTYDTGAGIHSDVFYLGNEGIITLCVTSSNSRESRHQGRPLRYADLQYVQSECLRLILDSLNVILSD